MLRLVLLIAAAIGGPLAVHGQLNHEPAFPQWPKAYAVCAVPVSAGTHMKVSHKALLLAV